MTDTLKTIVEQLQQKAREHRQEARRCDAAVKVLLEPQRSQGRPVNPKRDLFEAFRKSGLTYKELALKLGVGYRYISWVVRGIDNKPELECRIREILSTHGKAQSVTDATLG
jgi:hypothetical protein